MNSMIKTFISKSIWKPTQCFKEKKKSAKHNKVIKGVTEVLMGSSN